MYNHHANANDAFYEAMNETPGLVGEKLERVTSEVRTYFNTWVERDGYPFWSFWENVSSWWAIRHLPNIHFMHFEAMKRDMEGEIRRLAAFLDIEIDEARWLGDRRTLQLRLHEEARGQERAARRRIVGRRWRPSSTRARMAVGKQACLPPTVLPTRPGPLPNWARNAPLG